MFVDGLYYQKRLKKNINVYLRSYRLIEYVMISIMTNIYMIR